MVDDDEDDELSDLDEDEVNIDEFDDYELQIILPEYQGAMLDDDEDECVLLVDDEKGAADDETDDDAVKDDVMQLLIEVDDEELEHIMILE